MLFADDFPYANGDLIGQGRWVLSELEDDSPQVVSHAVQAVSSAEVSAAVLNVMTLAQFRGTGVGGTGGWWMSFTMTPTAQEAARKLIEVWIGDIESQAVFLQVAWDSGLALPTQQTVSYGNSAGVPVSVIATVGDLMQPHRYALAYRAGGRSLHAYVDGVEVALAGGFNFSGLLNLRFDLYQFMEAVSTLPVVSHVEVGLGHYAG